jgi:2'-5' RNA ligase
MRTFIAIELPRSFQEEISRVTGELRSYFPGVRWSNPENIHLTLRFLGEIDPAQLDLLKKAVDEAASQVSGSRLNVENIGFFGSKSNPRVIWLGLNESSELAELAGRVEKAVEEAGFGKADKPFRPHLTLARVRRKLDRPPDWEAIYKIMPASWPQWPVSEVLIIKSTLTLNGPIYETLARCPLQS